MAVAVVVWWWLWWGGGGGGGGPSLLGTVLAHSVQLPMSNDSRKPIQAGWLCSQLDSASCTGRKDRSPAGDEVNSNAEGSGRAKV